MNIWTLINWVKLAAVPEGGGNDGHVAGKVDDGNVSGDHDGGDGGSGVVADDVGDGDDLSGGAGDKSAGGKADGEAGKGAEGDAPKTMLEAIERGMSKEAQGPADGAGKGPKPAEGDKGKAAGKEKNEGDLLKVPEGLSTKAQERFQNLVNKNKELSQQQEETGRKLAETQGTLTAFQQEMSRTATTPDDLEVFFTFKEALASKDYEGAQKILVAQLKELQLLTGKPADLTSADALSDFPDLQQDVADLKITAERAHELAKARATEKRTADAAKRQQEAGQADAQKVAERETAIKSVQAWANEMSGKDIDYKSKEGKILLKLKEITKAYPPSLWLTRIKEAYTDIGESVAPAAGSNGGKAQPLRGGVGGGGGSPAPKSMHEAIAQGLNWNH